MSREFPRAVRFCLQRSADAVKAIAATRRAGRPAPTASSARSGRSARDLQYLELERRPRPRA